MTDNNLYIAVKANTEGENEVTSFAFGEVTLQDLQMIKEEIGILKQSVNSSKICIFEPFLNFVDDDEISEADKDFFLDICEKVGSSEAVLTQQEYEGLLKLPVLDCNVEELQIYKNGNIRACGFTNHFIVNVVHTNKINISKINQSYDLRTI